MASGVMAVWLMGLAMTAAATDGGAVTSVLVLPIEPRAGISRDLAETLTDTLAAELKQREGFRVVALRDVEKALSQEQRKQLAACDTVSCAVEIGGALNTDELVFGSIGRLQPDIILNLTRVCARDGNSLGSSMRRVAAKSESSLVDVLPAMVTELMGGGTSRSTPVRTQSAVQTTAASPNAPRRLAILYFDNNGKNAELEPLRKGLADMMITDIQQCSAVRVVEREKLRDVLKELELQHTASFDVSSAQRLGKLLGAEYVVLGSFFEVMGQFRMDARMIHVETAQVMLSEGVHGKKDDFISLEQQLVLRIISSLGVKLQDQEQRYLETKRNAHWVDATDYARAVEQYDQGDKAGAHKTASLIVARTPAFQPAAVLVKKTKTAP